MAVRIEIPGALYLHVLQLVTALVAVRIEINKELGINRENHWSPPLWR